MITMGRRGTLRAFTLTKSYHHDCVMVGSPGQPMGNNINRWPSQYGSVVGSQCSVCSTAGCLTSSYG